LFAYISILLKIKLGIFLQTASYISKLKNYTSLIGFKVDQSGYTSYFSNRKIINGDGLINSFKFYKYKQQNLEEYFIKYGYPNYILENELIYR
jgi:hypothetical protein